MSRFEPGKDFRLASSEDELWQQLILLLLAQRDQDGILARNQLALLSELSFHSRFCGKQLTKTFVEDTATWFAANTGFINSRVQAQAWLMDLAHWELLYFNPESEVYDFAFPTLDEYFAAKYLVEQWEKVDANLKKSSQSTKQHYWQNHKIRCSNPHCHTMLPPFRKLIWLGEYQETILLMVGLLRNSDAERKFMWSVFPRISFRVPSSISKINIGSMFLSVTLVILGSLSWLLLFLLSKVVPQVFFPIFHNLSGLFSNSGKVLYTLFIISMGILLIDQTVLLIINDRFTGSRWNFFLKAFSCCRYFHPEIANVVQRKLLRTNGGPMGEGVMMFGNAREEKNLYPLLDACISIVTKELGSITDAYRDPWAALILGNLAHPRGIEALYTHIKLHQGHSFPEAAIALGQIGDKNAVPTLIPLLNSPSDSVRRATADALGLLGDMRATESLILAFQNESDISAEGEMVRLAITKALGKLGYDAVRPLLELNLTKQTPVRRGVAAALGQTEDSRAINQLLEQLEADDWTVRFAAARSLGILGDATSFPALYKCVEEQYKKNRQISFWKNWVKRCQQYNVSLVAAQSLKKISQRTGNTGYSVKVSWKKLILGIVYVLCGMSVQGLFTLTGLASHMGATMPAGLGIAGALIGSFLGIIVVLFFGTLLGMIFGALAPLDTVTSSRLGFALGMFGGFFFMLGSIIGILLLLKSISILMPLYDLINGFLPSFPAIHRGYGSIGMIISGVLLIFGFRFMTLTDYTD